MSSFRRLSRIAAVVALLAIAMFLIAACGGDDDAEPEPAPESTASSTPIPTATPFARVPEPTIVASPTTDAGTGTSSSASSPSTPQDIEYVVEAGDNLSGIARRFETTVEAILERNEISDASLIFVGQRLIVPQGFIPADGEAGGDAEESADDDGGSDGSGAGTYVVLAGDTAYGIALQFDVTLEELAAANGTTVDALSNLLVGDELVIP